MEKNHEIDNNMFEIITEVSMGILLDIINHIEIYSHDFEKRENVRKYNK